MMHPATASALPRTFAGALLLAFAALGSAQTRYTFSEINLDASAPTGSAFDINDAGQILFGRGIRNADGTFVSIPNLPGATSATRTGNDLNEFGQVVGSGRTTSSATTDRPLFFSGGTTTRVGSDLRGEALGLNDSGVIVGSQRTSANSENFAALFSGTTTTLLTTGLVANIASVANAVNNAGTIIGQGRPTGFTNSRGLVFNVGAAPTVLDIVAGDLSGSANAINASGEIVGFSSGLTQNLRKAVRYAPGSTTPIAYTIPDGFGGSNAVAVNDAGLAVGTATFAGTDVTAFVFENGVGYDLNTLLDNTLPAGSILRQANGVDGQGRIVGSLFIPNEDGTFITRGFLLTPTAPVPEPATLAVLGLGAIALVRRRRSR